jgi:D-arginine dehydrogenase
LVESDVIVVGGGIAGSAAGYFLSRSLRVTLLEREDAPGRHATGRSAALFSEYYGPPAVRALTTASRAFLADPPSGFAEVPLLSPRGVLTVAAPGAEPEFEAALADAAEVGVTELDPAEATRLVPVLRPGFARAMHKPAAADLDVAALHQGYLRGIRAAGGSVVTRVSGAPRRTGAGWELAGVTAPVLVNAAGAWADEVATGAGAAPLGLVPRRRTACLVDPGADAAGWPLLNDVPETFYAKPESGALLVSPADSTPDRPHDVRPRDEDVALGLDRLAAATTIPVRSVRHAWAGLRTSAPDDLPVVGPDPVVPGLFWLAGLGGYGVQLSPAVGRLLAAAVLDGTTPAEVAPARFAAGTAA